MFQAGKCPHPKGDGSYKIPMPHIETPKFKFGERQQGGVGQGEGKPGDPIDGQGRPNQVKGKQAKGKEKRTSTSS